MAFNATGTMLAVGSDARYIAAWSTDHFNKIFDLRTLVGVRSVYGFDPRSGDLAFDGENGLVRILPQASERAGANSAVSARSGSGPYGRLNGIDVQFDDVPVYIAENAKSLPPAELACMRQP